jgi:N,N'-diacetyllegionaminate synthase
MQESLGKECKFEMYMYGTVKIIAEVGVNHNGDMSMATDLIYKAAEAGADFVKFQAFHPDYLVHGSAKKAPYQALNTGNEDGQHEMLKKYTLDSTQLVQLQAVATQLGIGFVCSVFDLFSLRSLSPLNPQIIKIPSGEIDHYPLLQAIGKLNTEVWLSTGMATEAEIRTAIDLLIAAGTRPGNLVIMHCHSQYPTSADQANLKVIQTLSNTLGLPIGYSDHTLGITCPVAAVALGAVLIEKHFTLDTSLPGPDHAASLNPKDFQLMVNAIRETEVALGSGMKHITEAEQKNKPLVRKGIYAARDIFADEILSEENLICLRPVTPVPASKWFEVCRQKAGKNYKAFEPIEI